jgi:hypothetical protein
MKNIQLHFCLQWHAKHLLQTLVNKLPKAYLPNLLSLLFCLSVSQLSAQTDSEYDIIDVEDELKKVCWPIKNTSKTEATTIQLETDTAGFPTQKAGGLASPRRLYNAVEIPNIFPNPDTAEIFDLIGNPMIINGDTIRFLPSTMVAALAQASMNPPLTPGYHWVGYESTPFKPDNVAVYLYNIFHRWYEGMPCNYESYGGRQWNSDNSGLSNTADTTFQPHPVVATIDQPISCYGFNNGVIKFNYNPMNYYTFSLNGSATTVSNVFSNLTAGIYTLTITDSFTNSCDTIITLTQPPSLGSSVTVTNCGAFTWPVSGLTYNTSGTYFFNSTVAASICPKQDTLILNITTSASTTTSVTSYNFYTWPVSGQTYTNSGIFFNNTVTPTGCAVNSILNLTIINSPFNMALVIDQPISCFGANDGSIQATAFPGSANYIYTLNGGMQMNNTGFFSGLGPGTYTVCAGNGTSTIPVCKTITLTQPAPLQVTLLTDSLVSCAGNDGKIRAIISGGTSELQPYLTFWTNAANVHLNPTNNFVTTLNNLGAGIYNISVEDDNGCLATQSILLDTIPSLSVTAFAKDVDCEGFGTPIIRTISGGSVPYTVLINGAPPLFVYPAGTYTILVTDARGCTATTLVTVDLAQPKYTTMTATSCGPYYWSMNGATYTNSGTYMVELYTVRWCPIYSYLYLTVYNDTSTSTIDTACNSYQWSSNGMIYTASGIYTATSLTANGCIRSDTLNLTIHQSSTATVTVNAINGFVWPVNGSVYTQSGNYTATLVNAKGCDSIITLQLTINNLPSHLNLRCFIEGYMESDNSMKPVLQNQLQAAPLSACDTIIVELHQTQQPFATLHTLHTVLQRNGDANCTFPPLFDSFFVVIKHRNALETWSALPVKLSGIPAQYNFTNAANKAFGANQVQVSPGRWAFYSGDIDRTENIDLADLFLLENEIANFNFGYLAEDINGDGTVDLLDLPTVEFNVANYIFSIHP